MQLLFHRPQMNIWGWFFAFLKIWVLAPFWPSENWAKQKNSIFLIVPPKLPAAEPDQVSFAFSQTWDEYRGKILSLFWNKVLTMLWPSENWPKKKNAFWWYSSSKIAARWLDLIKSYLLFHRTRMDMNIWGRFYHFLKFWVRALWKLTKAEKCIFDIVSSKLPAVAFSQTSDELLGKILSLFWNFEYWPRSGPLKIGQSRKKRFWRQSAPNIAGRWLDLIKSYLLFQRPQMNTWGRFCHFLESFCYIGSRRNAIT